MVLKTGDRKQMRCRSDSLFMASAPSGFLNQKGLSEDTRHWNGPCKKLTIHRKKGCENLD